MDNNLFKILIVDDQPDARFLLRSFLSEIKNVQIIGEADNSEKALYLIMEHNPNLMFMDINMPEKTGMELVQLIRKRNLDIPVVFVSAFEEYAIEVMRCGVFDFLLKPVDRNSVKKVVEKHLRINNQTLPSKFRDVLDSINVDSKIRINSNHSYILINPAEIVYCEADDGYTNIYLTNGRTEISNTSLSQIENKIKGNNFYRLGRSILINLDYIRAINKRSNKCTLHANDITWEVHASHKSIKDLLTNNYNYA